MTDQELLAGYTEGHSEVAFAELVRRHIDLVHSAALRMVRDPQLAEDVTQSVFLALAKQAKPLLDHPVLSGWLHRTAQNLAANAVRTDVRRRVREQEAAVMNELLSSSPEPSWEEIAPHLDLALSELSESDRDALILRYFEKKSAQEMAQVLGVSAEAAQKRASRAVERLREVFVQRGIAVGAGSLMALISANAVQAAPAGLAIAVSAVSALGGTAAVGTTKAIAMTTLQKALVAATITVLAGAGIYETIKSSRLRDQVTTLQRQQAPLEEQLQQLQRERDEARSRLAAVETERKATPDNEAELLRLRGMAGVARRAVLETEQLRAQLAQQAAEATNNPVSGAMQDAMKQALEQQVESRLARMTVTLHLTPDQEKAARAILLRQAEAMAAGMQQAFSGKYNKEELNRMAKDAGNVDEQIKALLTPEQQALYPEQQKEEAAHNAGLVANQELVQLQPTLGLTPAQLDRVYAALYEVSYNQMTASAKPPSITNEAEALQWVLDQKTKALEPILTETQMQSYRKQQEAQAKLVRDILSKMQGSGPGK